jgi:hypothetical protein
MATNDRELCDNAAKKRILFVKAQRRPWASMFEMSSQAQQLNDRGQKQVVTVPSRGSTCTSHISYETLRGVLGMRTTLALQHALHLTFPSP